MLRHPWTPGQWTLHRVLTAVLLACVPPAVEPGFQAAYWFLLLLYGIGALLPWPIVLLLLGQAALLFTDQIERVHFLWFALGVGWVGHHPKSGAFHPFTIAVPLFVGLNWMVEWLDSTDAGLASWIGVLLLAPCFLAALHPRGRLLAWCGLVLAGVVFHLLGSPPAPETWILQVLIFSPAWFPRSRRALPLTVYYDGECGFCHRGVQFLLKEDPRGEALRFAPLQSPSFAAAVPEPVRANLPDSIVVRDAEGTLLVRSSAALRVGAALGGYWRPLAAFGALVPRSLRDTLYDAIAKRRKRWFAKPEGHCPLLSAQERARFDP